MNDSPIAVLRDPRRRPESSAGFSLIELVIVVAIVGILSAIAYPSYLQSITKSRRAAAEACLANFATHMERFYTTNMRYTEADGSAPDLPALDCASAQGTGEHYTYAFNAAPTVSTFVLQAQPKGTQATRDAGCGTLTLNHAGTRNVTGSYGVDNCW